MAGIRPCPVGQRGRRSVRRPGRESAFWRTEVRCSTTDECRVGAASGSRDRTGESGHRSTGSGLRAAARHGSGNGGLHLPKTRFHTSPSDAPCGCRDDQPCRSSWPFPDLIAFISEPPTRNAAVILRDDGSAWPRICGSRPPRRPVGPSLRRGLIERKEPPPLASLQQEHGPAVACQARGHVDRAARVYVPDPRREVASGARVIAQRTCAGTHDGSGNEPFGHAIGSRWTKRQRRVWASSHKPHGVLRSSASVSEMAMLSSTGSSLHRGVSALHRAGIGATPAACRRVHDPQATTRTDGHIAGAARRRRFRRGGTPGPVGVWRSEVVARAICSVAPCAAAQTAKDGSLNLSGKHCSARHRGFAQMSP